MKRTPAVSFVAALCHAAVGCSSLAPPDPTPPAVGGAAPMPDGPTTWPRAHTDSPAHAPAPYVLAHGFSGFHNIGPLDYFYGVAEALRKDGHDVYVTTVDPFNDSFVRGAELQAQVEKILADSGAPRINLICHSQGGLDCRYVAAQLGGKIGAVVMIASPNHGTPVADVAVGALDGPLGDAVAALLNLLGTVLDPNGDISPDAKAAIAQMTVAGTNAFNARVPDHPDVAYFSVAGRSDDASGDDDCGTPTELGFIERWDQARDPVNPLLAATATILNHALSPTPTNDGMVPVYSARWGTFLGCVPADHFDEVCQIAGQASGSGFNCVDFYRTLVSWLSARGF